MPMPSLKEKHSIMLDMHACVHMSTRTHTHTDHSKLIFLCAFIPLLLIFIIFLKGSRKF